MWTALDRIHSLFFERSTVAPTFPIAFTLLQRSETLSAGQQPRPGDAQKRTSIKTRKMEKVKRFLGDNPTFCAE